MSKIFITGDRSMNPLLAVNLVMALLNDCAKNGTIDVSNLIVCTGDAAFGVDRAVRYLVPNSLVAVTPLDNEGKPNYPELHKHLNESVDKVFVLHSDPLVSRIAASVMQNFNPDKVVLPIQDALAEVSE